MIMTQNKVNLKKKCNQYKAKQCKEIALIIKFGIIYHNHLKSNKTLIHKDQSQICFLKHQWPPLGKSLQKGFVPF